MEQLVWKEIPGYEGLYEVNNMGEVRSIEHYVNAGNGCKRIVKPTVRPQRIMGHGYKTVSLCVDNKSCSKLVHRLVALAFIDNPDNLPQVNHIDGNKENNCVSNLEWVSDDNNKEHSSVAKGGTQRPKRKVIIEELSTGNTLMFDGLREAERHLSLDHKSCQNVIKGRQHHTKGYKVAYA